MAVSGYQSVVGSYQSAALRQAQRKSVVSSLRVGGRRYSVGGRQVIEVKRSLYFGCRESSLIIKKKPLELDAILLFSSEFYSMNKEDSILIAKKIHEIRSRKVMLDFDLAELYGIKTKGLRQAVKRNEERFPDDFVFVLDSDELNELVTSCDQLPSTFKHNPYGI